MAEGDSTGSTNPFDFDDTAGSPRQSAQPAGPDPGAADPFGFDAPITTTAPVKTGQPMSWTALVLAVVGAIAIGIGVAQALGSIQLEAAQPYARVLWWGTLALLGVLICLVAVVLGFVAMIKAQPRTVAVIAFVVALIIGWIAAYVGFRIGAEQLALEVARVTGAEGPEAVNRVDEYLRERGIDPGPLRPLLERIFG